MELFILSIIVALVVGGGSSLSVLFFMDRCSATKDISDVLPHEGKVKEFEAEFEEEKHIA